MGPIVRGCHKFATGQITCACTSGAESWDTATSSLISTSDAIPKRRTSVSLRCGRRDRRDAQAAAAHFDACSSAAARHRNGFRNCSLDGGRRTGGTVGPDPATISFVALVVGGRTRDLSCSTFVARSSQNQMITGTRIRVATAAQRPRIAGDMSKPRWTAGFPRRRTELSVV